MTTCSSCVHYHRFGEEPRGTCCYLPPVPFANGTVMQPVVQATRRACGQFKEGEGTVKEKVQVPSFGSVRAKSRNGG